MSIKNVNVITDSINSVTISQSENGTDKSESNRQASKLTIAERIRVGEEEAFNELFQKYYYRLCLFSKTYVNSTEAARDVVQDVFVNIWLNRENFVIRLSLKSYMFQAVRNQSLNYLKKNEALCGLDEATEHLLDKKVDMEMIQPEYCNKKLVIMVWDTVDELPEKRKAVFTLHKKHGLSYMEIAQVMEISTKTVENQMARALKFLREKLYRHF